MVVLEVGVGGSSRQSGFRRGSWRVLRVVFKAHRLLYHSTLGLRVIKKEKFTSTARTVKSCVKRRPGQTPRPGRCPPHPPLPCSRPPPPSPALPARHRRRHPRRWRRGALGSPLGMFDQSCQGAQPGCCWPSAPPTEQGRGSEEGRRGEEGRATAPRGKDGEDLCDAREGGEQVGGRPRPPWRPGGRSWRVKSGEWFPPRVLKGGCLVRGEQRILANPGCVARGSAGRGRLGAGSSPRPLGSPCSTPGIQCGI